MFQRFFSYIESFISPSAFKNEKEGKVRISFKYLLVEIILLTLGVVYINFKSVLPSNYFLIYFIAFLAVVISLIICFAWKIDYDEYEIVYRTWYFRKYTFTYHDIRNIYTSKASRKYELTTDNAKITMYESSMLGAKSFIDFAKKNTSSSVTKI